MSDPNTPRDPHEPGHDPARSPRGPESNPYTRYIIAGAAVIVLILAVIVFTGTGGDVGDPVATDPAIEEPGETGATPPADDPAVMDEQEAAPADPDAEPAVPQE